MYHKEKLVVVQEFSHDMFDFVAAFVFLTLTDLDFRVGSVYVNM